MSCCGGGGSMGGGGAGGSMPPSFMADCPNECCFLYKNMTDPCAQKMERNVRRNVYGQTNPQSCPTQCPPQCPPQGPRCLNRRQVSPCCPAPRMTLCKPDSCKPCCQQQKPCPPKCPAMPCFPKVCCPPPCCQDPCIKPGRKCFIPPPCCPPPCCKKMALVVSPPICPPKCCPPLPCCPPDPCACPCPPRGSCPVTCPVRPACPKPGPYSRLGNMSNQPNCSTPCCNPLPPCCVIVKPCQPRCAPSPCCPPPPACGISCPRPDPRCCPKPMVVSFKCPTSQYPMGPPDDGCSDVKCPVIRPDVSACGTGLRQQNEMCMMPVQNMPPPCCGSQQPSCNVDDNDNEYEVDCTAPNSNSKPSAPIPAIAPSKRLTRARYDASRELSCRPKWVKSVVTGFSWIVNFDVPQLAPLSPRYKKWTSRVSPATDSNFWASRFSSRKENRELIAALPVPVNCCPCPCH